MTDLTLVIGNKNYSSWSLRPWFFLKHFGIPFEETRIPLFEEGYKEKILTTSPSGKVPALKDGDLIVWDSLAIMEYLAEKYPSQQSWPVDVKTRALARSISAEMHSGFLALREHLPMNCRRIINRFVPPENAKEDINRVIDIWSNCRQQFQNKGPWLFGDFSIADCMYAPVVMRFDSYQIPTDALINDYRQTVRQHPDIQIWIRSSKEESEIIEKVEVK